MNKELNSIEKLMLTIKDKMRETPSYIVKGVFAEVILIAQEINDSEKREEHEKANLSPTTDIERTQDKDS
ncbi:hypothetical protein [Flavobacterium granuli]|uniref:Uncharacterized protein n=1 Tax=Flavobacterium granuli TaxID=280093 RepID=A0ABU1S0D9_9FLAO|nr:hypothetical protein [Flavobacterium granuli]MDR6844491.1 hypothetical protein [Flavobacterium granuli]